MLCEFICSKCRKKISWTESGGNFIITPCEECLQEAIIASRVYQDMPALDILGIQGFISEEEN